MIDIIMADEHGRLKLFSTTDEELPPEITVAAPMLVNAKFTGFAGSATKCWLLTNVRYSIYIPGEGLRGLVLHLYKPAPPRGVSLDVPAVQSGTDFVAPTEGE